MVPKYWGFVAVMIICESSGLRNDASVAMKVLSGLASPPIAEIPVDPAIDAALILACETNSRLFLPTRVDSGSDVVLLSLLTVDGG